MTEGANRTKTDQEKKMREAVEKKLHEADELMRNAELDEDAEAKLADDAVIWALASWLPASSYFDGIVSYTVLPEDKALATHYGRIHVAKMERHRLNIVK